LCTLSTKLAIAARLEPLAVATKGKNWEFHKTDADPWPSRLHGHFYDAGIKLDAITGKLYKVSTRAHCGNVTDQGAFDEACFTDRIGLYQQRPLQVEEFEKAPMQGMQAPWEHVLSAMKMKGTDTGAQATQTVEQLMSQAQTALRDGRAAGAKTAQAMLDGYAALVSGVLIGMSEGLQSGGANAANEAKPKKK